MPAFSKTSVCLAALSVFMTSSAAFADLSAQQVWDDWKAYMTGFGYDVQGGESMSGDTLTVSDVTMSMELPEEAGTFAMTMAEFSFTDNGDGTVSMSVPELLPLTIQVEGPDAEDVDIVADYVTRGFAMTASGDPSNITYNYSADEMTLALKELVVEGEAVDLGTASFTMADLAGVSTVKVDDLRNIEQKMTTGPVTYDMDISDPEGSGRMVMKGKFDSMGFEGGGSFPSRIDAGDMVAMLEAGFGFSGGFVYQGGSSSFSFNEGSESAQAASSSDSGSLQMAMDGSQLMYGVSASNMQMQMAGSDIPFPVELAMARSDFRLKMPVAKGDEEQDFALAITLGDFSMSDMIWGLFDPAGQLPRDPATIALDLSGKARLFVDILDPEQLETLDDGGAMPGELNSLTLSNLILRVAGAELTGSGAFTFDNSDLQTFDGLPAPDGSVDLKLTGGNGLLDKLVAMGLLPEQQAQGARMMMGLFAVPGDGEDTLTSKIEVQPDGKVLANGQRLK